MTSTRRQCLARRRTRRRRWLLTRTRQSWASLTRTRPRLSHERVICKLPTPGGAAAIPPTPRTPHGLTPLPTPRRLKELISAGKLKKNWGEQTEVARTGQPKEPAIGSEGEAARELAKKRTAEELEQDAEEHVPELMLPPEVSKRIRMASEESAASSSRSSA